jgi:hypothetical protein
LHEAGIHLVAESQLRQHSQFHGICLRAEGKISGRDQSSVSLCRFLRPGQRLEPQQLLALRFLRLYATAPDDCSDRLFRSPAPSIHPPASPTPQAASPVARWTRTRTRWKGRTRRTGRLDRRRGHPSKTAKGGAAQFGGPARPCCGPCGPTPITVWRHILVCLL